MVCGMRRDGSTWLMVVVDRPLVPWWSWMGCWDAATHGCCSAAMCWSSRWPVQFSIHRLVCLGCTGCMPKDSAGVHFYSLGWNLYVQRTEQSIQPRFTTIFLSMCTCRHLRCVEKNKTWVGKNTCYGSELFQIWLKWEKGIMYAYICLAPGYRCLPPGKEQLCNLEFAHTDLRGTPLLIKMEKGAAPKRRFVFF